MTPVTLETWTIRNKYGRFQLKRYHNEHNTFWDLVNIQDPNRALMSYGTSAEDCLTLWIKVFTI